MEALQDLGVYAVEEKVRNSGSLNSSLSSGGPGTDEGTALDSAPAVPLELATVPEVGGGDKLEESSRIEVKY